MSNFEELFDLIGELARRRYQAGERGFATLGLNHTEARLLRLLDQEHGSAAQDALSNKLFIDRTNAGRALLRLEQEGYIRRHKDDADKRANFVQMSPKGRKAVTEIKRLRKQMTGSFFGDLTEEDAGVVVGLLRKVVSRADDRED